MRKALKVLNPAIWLWNFFKYTSHLEFYRMSPGAYVPYDFSTDTRYF